MKLPSLRFLAVALIAVAASLTGTVDAQTPTVIDHLPYTITAKGTYVLTSDLSSTQTSGILITVAASNVAIDFQGHYISGPSSNAFALTGIYADERSNITLKNGTVANVGTGINLPSDNGETTNNLNHELDHLRVTRCGANGILLTNAPSSTITNCKVSYFGLSVPSVSAGIRIFKSGVTVQNCSISQGSGFMNAGILSDDGSFARQNTISNCTNGVINGTYQDNLTYGCTTPFGGGTDGGGNTDQPIR